MDSHIQNPKLILKQFKGENGKVFFLDLDGQFIAERSAAILGTSPDYYSEEMEGLLNKEIERPFSLLVNRIISGTSQEDLFITSEDDKNYKMFLKASMSRSDLAQRTFFNNSVTAFMYPDQLSHDAIVGFSAFGKVKENELEWTEDYYTTVIVNNSNAQFVTMRNCFYIVPYNEQACIVTPISPFYALALIHKTTDKANDDLTREQVYHIDDQETVELMNKSALKMEYIYNRSFLAASRKEELEFLLDYINENKDTLNKMYDDVNKTVADGE